MTDLQLALLVIGVAVVAGVLVYNRLQERAVRREAEKSFASRHADALLDEAETRREPTLEEAPAPAFEAVPRPAPAASGEAPDARIDYVVEVHGVPAAALRADWAALERRFARRVRLAEDGEGRVRAGLQMTSRSGVVSEADLLDFRARVESLATGHGGSTSAPEMRAALEAAQALDHACAEVDVQVALHVLGVPGLELGGDEPFQVAPRADGVTLLIDVPRTADLAASFEAMVRAARQAAAAHGGRLADDNGNPLGERALAAIGVEVEALRARLAELGIEPGSPLAQRLFS